MKEQNGPTLVTRPQCVVIAGPNGAGKSSAAPELLKDAAGVATFVNADVIAQGLAAFRPEDVAIEAGRIMLGRIEELMEAGHDFAFETTLSGRSVERLLARAMGRGYRVHVCYIWLPSADMAVARVALRVAAGGHHVAEDVVRRRFRRSLASTGRPSALGVATWRIYDGSRVGPPRPVASGSEGGLTIVHDPATWVEIVKGSKGGRMTPHSATEIEAVMRGDKAVNQAFVAAYRRTVLRHRRLSLPLVVWKDGRVVEVSADDVELPALEVPEPVANRGT